MEAGKPDDKVNTKGGYLSVHASFSLNLHFMPYLHVKCQQKNKHLSATDADTVQFTIFQLTVQVWREWLHADKSVP